MWGQIGGAQDAGVTRPLEGGQVRPWPPSRKPRRCLKAAKAAKTANIFVTQLTLVDGCGAGAGLLDGGLVHASGEPVEGRHRREVVKEGKEAK